MINIYALAARRADNMQANLGRPMTHEEWEGTVNRLVLSTVVEPVGKAKVSFNNIWIQPQVREQSRLAFNVDYNEDLSEWTQELIELESLISSLPNTGR